MKINLLLNSANQSWIIEKITQKLAEELRAVHVDVSITQMPDDSADLVHHMSWAFANIKTRAPSTMFITHLDDVHKLNEVRTVLAQRVNVGICMSHDTMSLLQEQGCATSSLYFISPAHDGGIRPKPIVIGITSRVYPDGRKREIILQNIAARMDLRDFEFRIFGMGWEATIAALKKAGAQVVYHGETDDFRADYANIQSAIPYFDYYLYLGLDEGSLGTLDALAAGVPTIITPQGFHNDIPHGITHGFLSEDDLLRIFTQIAAPYRARRDAVSGLTWGLYAQRHIALWDSILRGQPLPELVKNDWVNADIVQKSKAYRAQTLRANSLQPRRLLASLSRLPFLRPVRSWIDRKRFDR